MTVFLAENSTQLQFQFGQHAQLTHPIGHAALPVINVGDLVQRKGLDSLFDACRACFEIA